MLTWFTHGRKRWLRLSRNTAMIDRLMHHGEPIQIRGDSYRMKDKPGET